MRYVLFILGLLFVTSCKNEDTNKNEAPKVVTQREPYLTITEVDKSEYDSVAKTYRNSLKEYRIKKDKDSILRVPLGAERTKTFKDSGEEETTIFYSFVGSHDSLGISVVNAGYYEGGVSLVIDHETEMVFELWSEPLISQKGNFLAAYSGYGLEGEPVGIQVWKRDRKNAIGLVKLLELNQLDWSPEDACWDNNNQLYIKAKKLNLKEDDIFGDFVYYRLKFQDK